MTPTLKFAEPRLLNDERRYTYAANGYPPSWQETLILHSDSDSSTRVGPIAGGDPTSRPHHDHESRALDSPAVPYPVPVNRTTARSSGSWF
jgi:hypothetical protein